MFRLSNSFLVLIATLALVGCRPDRMPPKEPEVAQAAPAKKDAPKQAKPAPAAPQDDPAVVAKLEAAGFILDKDSKGQVTGLTVAVPGDGDMSELYADLVKLPSLAEIDQLLIDIPVKAGESGLEITSFSPKGEVSRGFYAEVPINVDVSGRYLDIASFFNRLADLKRIVHVGNITLKPEEQKGKEVVLKSNVTVTTYRFVDRTTTTPEGGT